MAEEYQLGVGTIVIEIQEHIAHILGQRDAVLTQMTSSLHQLAGSVGSLFPTVGIISGIAHQFIALFQCITVEEWRGSIEQQTRFQCLTGLLRRRMAELSHIAQCTHTTQRVLDIVQLADDIVHALSKRVARQFYVIIEIEHLVADKRHTTITAQQLEIEPSSQKTGLSTE